MENMENNMDPKGSSKSAITWIVLIVIIIIGVAVWASTSKNESVMMDEEGVMMDQEKQMVDEGEAMMDDIDTMMKDDEDSMMEDEKEMMEEGDTMMQKGTYESYSPEKLALADTGKVVLFFRASWCPTCRTLDADIKGNLDDIPGGVHILDVNYDDSTSLKQKYGVTYQHTLVQVDSSGNQITKWTGSSTLASLLGNIK